MQPSIGIPGSSPAMIRLQTSVPQQHQPHHAAYTTTTATPAFATGANGTQPNTIPSYSTVQSPGPMFYQVHPQNITHGFDSSGRFVGSNPEVSYPSASSPGYHNVQFRRTVEWYTPNVVAHSKIGLTNIFQLISDKEERQKSATVPVPPTRPDMRPEVAEYFTAENDEGYNQWLTRKTQELEEQTKKQEELRTVPAEIKALPGHSGPSIRMTSNEAYGQYLDLLPNPPAVYPLPAKLPAIQKQVLVKYRPSNISDHPYIPDHAFAVDPREMLSKNGCYTRGIHGSVYYPEKSSGQAKSPYTFRRSAMSLGNVIGEREKGFTWPVISPTGLEINRPVPTCVSILSGAGGKTKHRLVLPAKSVPYVYNRYVSYTSDPKDDPATEVNPAQKPQAQICIPCTVSPPKDPALNPCNLQYLNPRSLPLPTEVRPASYCSK